MWRREGIGITGSWLQPWDGHSPKKTCRKVERAVDQNLYRMGLLLEERESAVLKFRLGLGMGSLSVRKTSLVEQASNRRKRERSFQK